MNVVGLQESFTVVLLTYVHQTLTPVLKDLLVLYRPMVSLYVFLPLQLLLPPQPQPELQHQPPLQPVVAMDKIAAGEILSYAKQDTIVSC